CGASGAPPPLGGGPPVGAGDLLGAGADAARRLLLGVRSAPPPGGALRAPGFRPLLRPRPPLPPPPRRDRAPPPRLAGPRGAPPRLPRLFRSGAVVADDRRPGAGGSRRGGDGDGPPRGAARRGALPRIRGQARPRATGASRRPSAVAA